MAQSPVAEETIARPITVLIPPDRLNEEAEIIAQLMRGQRVDHFETVRRLQRWLPIGDIPDYLACERFEPFRSVWQYAARQAKEQNTRRFRP